MTRLLAAAAVLTTAGCGVLPTPRTDAALAKIYAPAEPPKPLTQGQIDARVARVERRFADDRRAERADRSVARSAAHQRHLIENAARRRDGQENLKYEPEKDDRDSFGNILLTSWIESSRERRAIERAKQPDPPRSTLQQAVEATLVTPFTLSADVVTEAGKAIHKTMLGMSSNEYRSRNDGWDRAGAFE